MSKITGTYTHEKNENIDAYFQALGVPYIARKMMALTSPKLTIQNENDEWIITSSTIIRTIAVKFKLGEEYEEDMPKGALKVCFIYVNLTF
ncbi:hypothetical protein BDFB_002694 [Asbolus verrucosus]|uniref:Uncharacterized protein n=1 Tax=Asbolus verrucosus TaxID=1661398 RepID=A0A482VNU2_ASBVE|nr:hypothetical protein BDFB_002694 [Asbolus verrucosus]